MSCGKLDIVALDSALAINCLHAYPSQPAHTFPKTFMLQRLMFLSVTQVDCVHQAYAITGFQRTCRNLSYLFAVDASPTKMTALFEWLVCTVPWSSSDAP